MPPAGPAYRAVLSELRRERLATTSQSAVRLAWSSGGRSGVHWGHAAGRTTASIEQRVCKTPLTHHTTTFETGARERRGRATHARTSRTNLFAAMRLFVCALLLHAAAAFVAPRPPRPAPLRASNDFENPNPFMKEVIDAVPTLQEGRTMQLVLGSEEPTPPSDAEQQKLRAAAADELRNIDGAERSRRLAAGRILAVVTLLQSAFLCASHAAFLPRLSLLPGLFLSLGLYDSAKTGL